MLINALRRLISSGKYTVFNMLSLTLGLTLTILIVMLINYEISFDKFHHNSDEILCVIQHDLKDGTLSTSTPYPLPRTLKNDFPEVKAVAAFNAIIHTDTKVQYNNLSYTGFKGASVDPEVFSLFDFQLLLGDKENILSAPDKMVISKSMAKKIFGSENPVGKVLEIEHFPFTVEGIYADLPNNSSLNFDILCSEKINEIIWSDAPKAWWASGLTTFVILHKGITVQEFNDHLEQIPERYYPDFLKGRSTYTTRPFKSLHFDTSMAGGLIEAVSPKYMLILALIASLTLIIACINFISLSIAQSGRKTMEAGVRRISGASPFQIIKLYITSSGITVAFSLLLACLLCQLVLPIFESFTDRQVAQQFSNPVFWTGILLISAFIILLTGIYPGNIFARVQPILTLKNKGLSKPYKTSMRGAFIIFQFVLTISLLASQIFIFKQIRDMKNTDLGFDYTDLAAIDVGYIGSTGISHNERYEKVKVYKAELERFGAEYGFGTGSVTENIPGYYFQNSFTIIPSDSEVDECLVVSTAVDENYLDLFKINLMRGRFFSETIETDKQAFIINETAFNRFGWKDIQGKYLKLSHESERQPVIGVISDFTETSLREQPNPMIFRFERHNNFPGFLTYHISSENKDAAVAFMKASWEKIFPETPFRMLDVKETYYKNYEAEKELARIISIFSFFAILLTIIGLTGLITYTTEIRTKEIGVRKVNGAKINQVIVLLNREIVRWVIIAFMIALPITWFAIGKWLENFVFKTTISWWVFTIAGIIALVIALITVSWISWRAATRNPVEALRYE